MSPTAKVLVVEDDPDIRALLVTALRREALEVDAVEDGQEALRMCESFEYAIILLDLMLPVLDGFQFIDAFVRSVPNARTVVLVITAFDDRIIDRLTWPRVHGIVRKPFDIEQLATTVRDVALSWSGQARTPLAHTTGVDGSIQVTSRGTECSSRGTPC